MVGFYIVYRLISLMFIRLFSSIHLYSKIDINWVLTFNDVWCRVICVPVSGNGDQGSNLGENCWYFIIEINPLLPNGCTAKNLFINKEENSRKNFLSAMRLWVGRRWQLILGYISRIYKNQNSGGRGIRNAQYSNTYSIAT